MSIIVYYKQWALLEKDGEYLVIDKPDKKILYIGPEEHATKIFVMLIAGFIDETFVV